MKFRSWLMLAAALIVSCALLLRRYTLLFYRPNGEPAGIALKHEPSWAASTTILRRERPWSWSAPDSLLMRSYRLLTSLTFDVAPMSKPLCVARIAPTVGGCARWETHAPDEPTSLSAHGTLMAVQRGEWACADYLGVDVPEAARAHALTLHVRVAERTLLVSVALPWRVQPFVVGSALAVESLEAQGYFDFRTSHLTVRDADGRLLFWVAQTGIARPLTPPDGLTVEAGAEACAGGDACGLWAGRDLTLRLGAEKSVLPYRGFTSIGPYVALSKQAETARPEAYEGCPDWTVDRKTLALVRGELARFESESSGPCATGTCGPAEYCALPADAACDARSTEARCQPLPSTCSLLCPGVCGCDGRFYCNACLAQQRGRTAVASDRSCAATPCDSGISGGVDEDGVYGSLEFICHGQNFGVRCESTAPGARCECFDGGLYVSSFARGTLSVDDLLRACGFPTSPR